MKTQNQSSKSGRAAALVANAVFWAAAMLIGSHVLKERPWGDDFVTWMIVGFSLSNGLLLLALGRSKRC